MLYIGIDNHKRFSQLTVSDKSGRIVKEGRITNTMESLELFTKDLNDDYMAVLEAGPNWTVMHDILEEKAADVVLAHPLKVRAIAEAKIKTDRIDSNILAHLLRADLIPRAYVPAPDTRDAKRMVRQRIFFTKLQTMTKNRIHAIIDRNPQKRAELGEVTDLFGSLGKKWLAAVKLGKVDRALLDKDLELLAEIKTLIASSDRWIASFVKDDDRAKLLKTIPGIGNILAAIIALEIDDVRRFRDQGKLVSYAGLVPSLHQSGSKSYKGPITKEGNRYLRWAFVEAVWPAIRSDVSLKLYYEGIKAKKCANVAKVATARRIAMIAYRILSENRTYFPGRPQRFLNGGA